MRILLLSLLCLLSACATKKSNQGSDFFQSVTVDTLLNDKINCRAIIPTEDKVYYAGDQGRIGFIDYNNKKKSQFLLVGANNPIEFRSIAQTSQAVFVLSIGNPAQLFKCSNDLSQSKKVYSESHEKVFYDSMQFWNEQEGIAIGDPVADCLSIIRTKDGGNSWQKIPCGSLPKVDEGEAAFAASNTNIIIKGNDTWIVTGGKKARIFYSSDKGNHWQTFETPIVQGLEMTGIYTADFYNNKIGLIAGGNYEKQNENFSNKAMTFDGGKTWELVGEHQGFGYASCIQFVPESKGSAMVCAAGNGLWYSHDYGETWKLLFETKALYTLRFLNKKTAVAAGRSGIFKLDFK